MQEPDSVDFLAGLFRVRSPSVDRAPDPPEEVAAAVDGLRQAHGQATNQRQGAGQVRSVLVVFVQPAAALSVQRVRWEIPVVTVQWHVAGHTPAQAVFVDAGKLTNSFPKMNRP